MRLGIDIDGVLANFTDECAIVCKQQLGIPRLDLSSWGLALTKEQEDAFWDIVRKSMDFWLRLEPFNDVPRPLRFHPNDTAFFITNRKQTEVGESIEEQSAMWIERELDIEFPTVLSLKNKGEVCRALRIDAFIDDRPENCYDIATESPNTRVYLCSRPWNQHITDLNRVASMEDFLGRRNNGQL